METELQPWEESFFQKAAAAAAPQPQDDPPPNRKKRGTLIRGACYGEAVRSITPVCKANTHAAEPFIEPSAP
jgi:hypothetical protein